MPRPLPLVALHGAVNFDKLVPFDSAPGSPPLANNDILVMRKAAGGDNLTLQISDINATGSVNIAQLTGGLNDDMLYRAGGVWTGTGSTGLTYDGTLLRLDTPSGALLLTGGAPLVIENGGGISIDDGGGINIEGDGDITVEDDGNIQVTGQGNIEQTGTGNIEINGGGMIQVSGGSQINITDADGKIILESDEPDAILLEGDSGILFDGNGNIIFDGSGFIEMGNGQIFANAGDEGDPGITFNGDPDTGMFRLGTNTIGFTTAGTARFVINPTEFSGVVVGAPLLKNLAASSTNPNIVISSSDVNTGIGTAGADILSHIAGGVEGFRVAETGAVITNTIFGNLVSSITTGPALFNEAATATNPVLLPRANQPQTGIGAFSTNAVSVIALSTEGFRVAESEGTITNTIFGNLVSSVGSGPAMLNVATSSTVPVFVCNQADPDTGLARSGVNQSSIVNGGVEALRVRDTTATVAANSNLLVWDYDDSVLKFLQFGADDSAGAGFKTVRVIN
jgi:hypothetical protein